MSIEKAKEELKNYLGSLSILILRTLARQVGVINPTKTAKDDLIAQMIAVLVGETEPCEPSKRGAPVKEAAVDPKYMRGLRSICEKYQTYGEGTNYGENTITVNSPSRPSGSLSYYDTPLYKGVLEIQQNGCSFIRVKNGRITAGEDVFVPLQIISEQDLREGDYVVCYAFSEKGNNNPVACKILSVNGKTVFSKRPVFDTLTQTYPTEKIRFSDAGETSLSRVVDLFTPVARGQRVLLESPKGTSLTAVLRDLLFAVKNLSDGKNAGNLHPLALLLQQRPEEIEEFSFLPEEDIIRTGFNGSADERIRSAKILFNRAKRIAEEGDDAVIFVDSLTKLSRACLSLAKNNESVTPCSPDAEGFELPKEYFLSAGKFKEGGSITFVGAIDIDENLFDQCVYETFSPMSNCRIRISRELFRRHASPAIDLSRSYTEREERLLTAEELEGVCLAREYLLGDDGRECLELLNKTPDNQAFIRAVKERLGK